MREHLCQWTDHLDVLVLNASSGLERDLVAAHRLSGISLSTYMDQFLSG